MRLTLLILIASVVACGAATPRSPKARAVTPSARPRLVLGVETACVLTPGSRAECEGSYATEIEALGEVRAMALGDDSGCAITVDARLWCWGGSAGSCHGGLPAELPAGSEHMPAALVARCSPRPIELPATVTEVWAGSTSTCAALQGGGLLCAGRGWFGESPTHQRIALDVPFSSLAFADDHACLLSDDRTVRCIGANQAGQLGDGTAQPRTTVVEVVGLPPVRAIDVSEQRSCALDEEGGVWCWGNRGTDRIEIDRTPVRLAGAPLRTLSVERLSTCGLDARGNAHCAGSSFGGRIGFEGGSIGALTHAAALGAGADELAVSVHYTCVRRGTSLRCVGETPSRAPGLAASFVPPGALEPSTLKPTDPPRDESASCTADDDCVLALRAGCCGSCSGNDDYVAVHRNKARAQRALACPEPMACPQCVVPMPRVTARCVSSACTLGRAP